MTPVIRPSMEADLPEITAIYTDAVETTAASFEWTAPDLSEMTRRWKSVVEPGYPWLVAELDGVIAGYAYAAPFRPRRAYDWTLENSVYVAPAYKRRGIARALMDEIVTLCEARGARRMVAVISDSANIASIGFHEAMGFEKGGVLPSMGWKFDAWHDLIIMHRPLGEGDKSPPEILE